MVRRAWRAGRRTLPWERQPPRPNTSQSAAAAAGWEIKKLIAQAWRASPQLRPHAFSPAGFTSMRLLNSRPHLSSVRPVDTPAAADVPFSSATSVTRAALLEQEQAAGNVRNQPFEGRQQAGAGDSGDGGQVHVPPAARQRVQGQRRAQSLRALCAADILLVSQHQQRSARQLHGRRRGGGGVSTQRVTSRRKGR